MDLDQIQESLCKLAAQRLSRTDWHQLSENEKQQVYLLEEGGYLKKKSQADGFVGAANF